MRRCSARSSCAFSRNAFIVLTANAAMVMLHWDIGRMILDRQGRAGWGANVIDQLAADLRNAFPRHERASRRAISGTCGRSSPRGRSGQLCKRLLHEFPGITTSRCWRSSTTPSLSAGTPGALTTDQACGLVDVSLATAYGKQTLVTGSRELTAEFGAGFSYPSLTRMIRFAEWMTNERILATPSQELSGSWSSAVADEPGH